jgi:hypothetical protein
LVKKFGKCFPNFFLPRIQTSERVFVEFTLGKLRKMYSEFLIQG